NGNYIAGLYLCEGYSRHPLQHILKIPPASHSARFTPWTWSRPPIRAGRWASRSRRAALGRTRAAAWGGLAAGGSSGSSLAPHCYHRRHLRRYPAQHRILINYDGESLLASQNRDLDLACFGVDGGNRSANSLEFSRNDLLGRELFPVRAFITKGAKLIPNFQFRK